MSDTITLEQALALHRQGDLAAAEAAYRTVLAREPHNLQALAQWANLALQTRRYDQAAELLAQLDKRQPGNPQVRRALSMALNNQGSRLRQAGQTTAALDSFRRAVAVNPDNAEAHYNRGVTALDQGLWPEALQALDEALRHQPADAEAHANRGRALLALQRRDEARDALQRAATLAGADPRLLRLIAEQYQRAGDPESAVIQFRRALAAAPHDMAAHLGLAQALNQSGDDEAATAQYRTLLQDEHAPLQAALGARLTLPAVYRDHGHLRRARERFTQGVETLNRELDRWCQDDAEARLADVSWSNFYLAYQGENDRDLQARYGDFLRGLLSCLAPALTEPPHREHHPRPRVGFLSSFFRRCTVGAYFGSWVEAVAGAGFDTYLFQLGPLFDEQTEHLKGQVRHYEALSGNLRQMAEAVRRQRLDVLIFPELGMDARVFPLAALRLAPVQCTAWGHPVTSGLASIDYFFSSALMEPPDAAGHYTETLVPLPGLGTRYTAPEIPPDATRGQFGLPERAHLYLLPQSPFKIHPDNDALIADILSRDPRGRLVLFEGQSTAMTGLLQQRLGKALTEAGLDPERLHVLPVMSRADYLRVNQVCDVMLDTVHWSGGNTSLDALAAGLPIVTLPGRFMRGRQSAGMLQRLGLEALIAADSAGYTATALRLASEPDHNREMRECIEERKGRLFGDSAPLAALVEHLHGLLGR